MTHVVVLVDPEATMGAHGSKLSYELSAEDVAEALHVRWEAEGVLAMEHVVEKCRIV